MMEEDGLNNRNWGYYESSPFRANHGFQLMPSILSRNDKSYISGLNQSSNLCYGGVFGQRDCSVSADASFLSFSWLNQHRDSKFFSMLPNPSASTYSGATESPRTQPMQLLQLPRNETAKLNEPPPIKTEAFEPKQWQRDAGPSAPKARKERKRKHGNTPRTLRERSPLKKTIEMVINGVCMDISGLPIPVCSCTGRPQQCYRWGRGGWQSACCTTNVSMYPLPVSTKRRGARIAGRKMSQGAFKKVLEKLAGEAYDFSNQIDLKSHWARHGTNKFVTIR